MHAPGRRTATSRHRTRREAAFRTAAVGLALAGLVAGCSDDAPSTAGAHASGADRSTPGPALRDLANTSGLRFGAAINTDLLGTDDAYTAIAATQYSTVTPENVMKWEVVEPREGAYDFTAADRLVDFAQQHDQLVRGHTLVWHSQLPSWLTAKADSLSADQLRAILKKHVQTEVEHFKGTIWQWDVVNEAYDDDGTLRDDIWSRKLGDGYIADAFRWAHEADPDAKLFYNDYLLEYPGAKRDAVYAMVKKLQAQGVPIDGVGFQDHLDTKYGAPDLQAGLQQFADLGLDVAVTEADVRTTLPASADAQATQDDLWSRSLSACLLVQRCISFTTWGIDDGSSWIPGVFEGEGDGLLYDADYAPTSQYAAVQEAFEQTTDAPHR